MTLRPMARKVGNLNGVLVASGNHAEYLMMRGRWDDLAKLLTDPLWHSATGRPHIFRLLSLATSEALQGHTADAGATLRAALDAVDVDAEELWGEQDAEVAFVQVLTGETTAALDWAQRVLEDPELILWIEPLIRVLMPAGQRRQVEALATASLESGSTVDLRHGVYVRALVAVDPDDAATLAEALTSEAASSGLVLDELLWTIGLARWLPEGHADRVRLMSRARDRIDATGFGGLAQFLDQ